MNDKMFQSLPGPRVIGNIVLHRATSAALRLRVGLQRILSLTHEYQADPFATEAVSARGKGRPCEDRYDALSEHLPNGEPLSVLDIGCNRGYFVLRMAERGGFCIGIDSDRNEIMYARAQAEIYRIPNVVFATMIVDGKSVESLPSVDVTLCMSIFHHWVRSFGVDKAKDIMQVIACRTVRYLIFESGGCEETEAEWAPELSFMGADSTFWTRRFLTDLGFSDIYEAGPFSTTVSQIPRMLYIAKRDIR